MKITTQHLYTVPNFNGRQGYCAAGSRIWFAEHGLSWADFVANGLDEEAFLATGDALALRLVEHARSTALEEAGHGR